MQQPAYLSDRIFLSVPNILYPLIFYVNTCPALIQGCFINLDCKTKLVLPHLLVFICFIMIE